MTISCVSQVWNSKLIFISNSIKTHPYLWRVPTFFCFMKFMMGNCYIWSFKEFEIYSFKICLSVLNTPLTFGVLLFGFMLVESSIKIIDLQFSIVARSANRPSHILTVPNKQTLLCFSLNSSIASSLLPAQNSHTNLWFTIFFN